MQKLQIYKFGTKTDGNASMKDVLGGKGANLAEMSSLGLPVPPGFTIPCEASVMYEAAAVASDAEGTAFHEQIKTLVAEGIKYLVGKGKKSPLMSVRSGARVSMPGMMDTILNVGMTTETLPYWTKQLGAVAALDSYRRLIQMYASVALGIKLELFEEALTAMREDAGVKTDSELNEDQLNRLVKRYLKIVDEAGHTFPDTPMEQVMGAVAAVFRSWNNPRAKEYRKIHSIPDTWGTAVTVQSMVFGNLNDNSATGVLFSRDPSSGAKGMRGEFLVNAQGEDVVAGIRTPESLDKLCIWNTKVADELYEVVQKLETHYKDMQDIEFTVEDGKLYLLQTRNGKRSAIAAFQIAYDMTNEGLITKDVAVGRVSPAQLYVAMQDQIDPSFKQEPHLTGLAAGGGVVTGEAVFTADDAINCKSPCILVTKETDPDDIGGMNASVGILTATGGLTSHAAVVARGMNKSCVVGCTDLVIQHLGGSAYTGHVKKDGASFTFVPGSSVTIDGATGRVWFNIKVPMIAGGASDAVKAILSWASTDGTAERLEVHSSQTVDTMHAVVKACKAAAIHIDTVTIEGADRYLLTNTLQGKMSWLGQALADSVAETIVVDLKGLHEVAPVSDTVLLRHLGASTKLQSAVLDSKVAAMIGWPQEVIQRTIVVVGKASAQVSTDLREAGYKVSGMIATVADLLNASGPMTASPEVIQNVFGGTEAFNIAKQAIEKLQGISTPKALPVPAYWYEPLTTQV